MLIHYGRGGQTFRTEGRIRKKFEAKGRTDWKSKKKSSTSALCTCPIFQWKSSEEQKKSSSSADVLFFNENPVKSKKRLSTSANVLFSTQNQVKSMKKVINDRRCSIFHLKSNEEQEKGHQHPLMSYFSFKLNEEQKNIINVRRCPIFHSKSNEDQKKRSSTSADVLFFIQNQVKSKKEKGYFACRCPIFHSISVISKV